MSYIGHKIVATAITQLGKDDSDCPDGGCYSGNGTNWCSEFVSWVYNEAGAPFTGGRKGGWLLVDTFKIRRWFKQRQAYVDRDDTDWDAYVPTPGDYVFIGRVNNRRREHSGLVEHVDGTTLHTIEGNNSGRVVARYVYPNFRTNTTSNKPDETNGYVRGFGAKSGKQLRFVKRVGEMCKSGVNFGYTPENGGPHVIQGPVTQRRGAMVRLYVPRASWRGHSIGKCKSSP